jgi:hypothetical protein
LVVSQLLLIGTGVLARWLIDCGSDACAGTARAYSPFGSPRDVLLTARAAALPYLLAVFAAAVAWLLAGRAVARPARSRSRLHPQSRRSTARVPVGLANGEDFGK